MSQLPDAATIGQVLLCHVTLLSCISAHLIPTGPLLPCLPCPACPTVVSDAAAGGQVLMCSETFRSVQHMCEELGCVDHNGMNITRLNAQRAPWWILG